MKKFILMSFLSALGLSAFINSAQAIVPAPAGADLQSSNLTFVRGGGGGHAGGSGGGHMGGSHASTGHSFGAARGGSYGHSSASHSSMGHANSGHVARSYTRNGDHMHVDIHMGGRFYGRDYAFHRGWRGYGYWGWAPLYADAFFFDAFWFGAWNSCYYGSAYGPCVYDWGFRRAAWYGYYPYYYTPYRVYMGPSYWLTDYVVADYLAERAADADHLQAPVQQANQNSLTPADKEQLRTQVDQEVKAYQKKDPVTVDTTFHDLKHLYTVDQEYNVVDSETGKACVLSQGDLIRVQELPIQGEETATVEVMTAKHDSCSAGAIISFTIQDLQGMVNSFNERIEQGMTELEKQKTAGKIKIQ